MWPEVGALPGGSGPEPVPQESLGCPTQEWALPGSLTGRLREDGVCVKVVACAWGLGAWSEGLGRGQGSQLGP